MREHDNVKAYQKECYNKYKRSIGYPEDLTYLYGNPLNVQVPIETNLGKYMIVGAYPSAKFYTVNGLSYVPITDNDSPFSNESYYDGSGVRTIPSGKELNEVILSQIGIKREECWITDLVKVFLFKQGHIDRYHKLGKTDIRQNRSDFREFAVKSIPWLIKEIKLSMPKVVILLGAEVTSVLFRTNEVNAKVLLDGSIRDLHLEDINIKSICLPHPGILMKPSLRNSWPERFGNEIAPTALQEINRIR
jgi:hypothetical protein